MVSHTARFVWGSQMERFCENVHMVHVGGTLGTRKLGRSLLCSLLVGAESMLSMAGTRKNVLDFLQLFLGGSKSESVLQKVSA